MLKSLYFFPLMECLKSSVIFTLKYFYNFKNSLQCTDRGCMRHLTRNIQKLIFTFPPVDFSCVSDSSLYRRFSDKGVLLNSFDPNNVDENFVKNIFTSKYVKMGILIDMQCKGSFQVLKIANKNFLFRTTQSVTSWLILMENHIPFKTVEEALKFYEPNISDAVKYLTDPYEDNKNSDLLVKINQQINAEFLKSHRGEAEKISTRSDLMNDNILSRFFDLDLLPDTEMTLAIPGAAGKNTSYELYDIYKPTKESKVVMNKYALIIFNNESFQHCQKKFFYLNASKRKNFGGAILKGASAMNSPEYFTTIDDLSTSHSDVWTKMTYGLVKLLADDLNFRIIVRFFDNYGWEKNGKFDGLMLHLQEGKADIAATGLVFRPERYRLLDYMDAPYRLQVGLLFRQPPLSSVSNIFVLPFSLTVWRSIAVLTIIIVLALWFHMRFGKNIEPSNENINYYDVVSYVIGTVCQQGHHVNPMSYSGRIIVIFLHFASLALFTSYSANIVALLQSPSSAIRSVEEITSSKMQAGIQQNFALFTVYLKETSHRPVKEFYVRKLAKKGDKAYLSAEEGIKKIRKGMFAYQVDLSAAYKIISETYEEKEKCGLKEIELFTKPFMGTAVPKNSPYKELFTRRLRWQWEVGLTTRTWKRWIPQKPKCESGRSGFLSVGLTEFHPAILVVVYGITASFILFVLELVWYHGRKCLFPFERKKL